MTIPSIVTTARSLSFYSRLQEVTANNLANASTEGFKADRVTGQSFRDHFPETLPGIDLQQGTLRDTGRPLDVGIEGEGFLVVQTPEGERLTRGGGLEIDRSGFLTDRDGNRLLGLDGPMQVAGRQLVIEGDGTVVVDGALAGRLRIETVADPASLEKEGLGRFRATGPLAASPATLRQGTLEDSNVQAVTATVDLIRIQRAYTAGVDAMRTVDGVMGAAIDIGRP